MTNAKQEWLELVNGKKVVAAWVGMEEDWDTKTGEDIYRKNLRLLKGHTEEEYAKFLECLDFEYDSGFGCQELFGMIWYGDGSWSERDEYDGSEWWSLRSLPQIPEWLQK